MNSRRAIYPGSFDPITLGPVDVARRAAQLFDEVIDEVIVAVYEGQEKPGALFSTEERIGLAREVVATTLEPNIRVDSFSGLTVDYARSQDAGVIVRGLRAVSDFEYEFKLAQMTSSGHSFISSSLIREVAALGGDVDGLVPALVGDALRAKLAVRV